MRFDVKEREDGQTMFNIVADNNEVIATSEGYHHEQDALDTIETIKQGASDARIVIHK